MAVSPRIEELRRRVEKDPASIAFAQLAEEHRRGGDFDEAIRVCQAGLARHPGYLSARVTLGRALIAIGQIDAGRAELERVVAAAPDNLAAVRALAELATADQLPTPNAQLPREMGESAAPSPHSFGSWALEVGSVSSEVAPQEEAEALRELESWLEAILSDRRRTHASP